MVFLLVVTRYNVILNVALGQAYYETISATPPNFLEARTGTDM
jgi:hypothetical protein